LLSFLADGLEDIAVSRTGVKWGIPVPFDPAHTIYVWIDALCNYITALGYGSPDDQLFRTFWPANVHVVGKDVSRFHAVIWPALLAALDLPAPDCVFAHGFLNVNGEKISKSAGNGVPPEQLIAHYGVDALRNYLLREIPYAADGEWSEAILLQRTNADLANDLGNLLSRTTQLLVKFAEGTIPEPAETDGILRAEARQAVAGVAENLEQLRFADALSALWRLIDRSNKYIEEQQPWRLAKDPSAAGRLSGVLYDLAEALRVTAAALVPFLVTAPEGIYEQLGLVPTSVRSTLWDDATAWGGLRPGTIVRRGEPLFPRL
jgi:methionyl-tRNA synthetase